jgi:hypothetical protein
MEPAHGEAAALQPAAVEIAELRVAVTVGMALEILDEASRSGRYCRPCLEKLLAARSRTWLLVKSVSQ